MLLSAVRRHGAISGCGWGRGWWGVVRISPERLGGRHLTPLPVLLLPVWLR